jgi:SAM-dependent methyltransferase
MAERLHFNTGMVYESMMAAEHLSRYWMLREACRGKRVLDVACGEGYGSALLRSWGAVEVVGVDISDDAVRNATQLFGAQGIRFLQGDACDLDTVLDTGTQYDLIACFETLEHVPDVPALLQGLHKRLAPGGSMAVSCPNDVEVSTEPNEYHLRTYTFEEFKDTATAVLGEPVQWHLGTSMIGFGICEATDAWALGQGTNLRNMLDGADALPARMLPAQSGHELSPASAYFYVGVWGDALPRTVVAAPIAYRAYTMPWNNWVAAKGQVETIQREATQRAQHLANERTARLQLAEVLHTRSQRIRHLEVELAVLRASRMYQLGLYYYRSFQHPATRWFMRPLRRMVVGFRRMTKPS